MAIMRLQRELLGVTLSLACLGVANGLVGVFIPLLILQSGAPLWQIPAFYVGYALVKLFINFPIARFVVQKRGVHTAFGLGFAAAIVELAALRGFVASGHLAWIFLAAVAMAVVNACIWISQHLHISSVIEGTTKSSNMATIATIDQVLGIAAPFVGGLIGAALGPVWLLGVAIAFIVAAFIPLRLVGRLEEETVDRNEVPLRYSIAGVPKRDLLANFCWNVETSVGGHAWPIFLAVEVATYKSIGIIGALGAAASLIALWVAGHRGDKGGDRRVLTEAASVASVINILRLFVSGTFWVSAISVAYRGSLAYGQVSWSSSYYGHAKQRGAQWVMAMEIACDFAYLSIWSVLLVVAVLADSHTMFTVAFALAAAAAWGCLALTKQKGHAELSGSQPASA